MAARRLTQEEFLMKLIAVHQDKYSHEKVQYITNKIPVTISCNKHGDWKASPGDLLKGTGCPKCATEARSKKQTDISEQRLISLCMKKNYELLSPFKNVLTKITYRCQKHPDTEQEILPASLFKGSGCYFCGIEMIRENRTTPFSKVKDAFREAGYELLETEYKHNTHPLRFICQHHGEQTLSYKDIARGYTCRECSKNSSSYEVIVNAFLKNKKIDYSREMNFDSLRSDTGTRLRFDFCIHKEKQVLFLIEIQGRQHFYPVDMFGGEEEFIKLQQRDKMKVEWCKDNKIPLLVVRYNSVTRFEEIFTKFIIDNGFTFLQEAYE